MASFFTGAVPDVGFTVFRGTGLDPRLEKASSLRQAAEGRRRRGLQSGATLVGGDTVGKGSVAGLPTLIG